MVKYNKSTNLFIYDKDLSEISIEYQFDTTSI